MVTTSKEFTGKEYFSHDYFTRNKRKISALLYDHGTRGYGLWWIIVELMYEATDNWLDNDEITYRAICKESGEEIDFVRTFITDCIETYNVFLHSEGKITTQRVLDNVAHRREISDQRRDAGLKSAEVRRLQAGKKREIQPQDEQMFNDSSTGAEQLLSKNQHSIEKESIVNEKKEKDSISSSSISLIDQKKIAEKIDSDLQETEIENTIEYVSITGKKNFSAGQVREYWKAFVIHATGKVYNDRTDRIQHFRNWLKTQPETNLISAKPGDRSRAARKDPSAPGTLRTPI